MENIYRKFLLNIKDQKADESLLSYFELLKNDIDEKVLVTKILNDTIPILYRTKYFHVPHGFMAIMAALTIGKRLPEYKDLALAQAISYLTHENKLAPLNLSAFDPLYTDSKEHIKTIESFVTEGNAAKTYRYFLGLKNHNHVNEDFHKDMIRIAMKDNVNIGHKVIYYHKILELVDYLQEEPPYIYYPCVSYLASEPKDYLLYELAENEYKNLLDLNINLAQNTQNLSSKESNSLVESIIYSMKSKVLSNITRLLTNGVSIKSISDNLIIAASQLILDTEYNNWIKPVHAFNYCHALNWWIRTYEPEDSILALYLQATIINNISIELKKVHFLSSSIYIKNPNNMTNMVKAINISNVSDAVSLCKGYILSHCNIEEMINLLTFLSIQNGSIHNFSHNLKLTSSCIKEFDQNTSPNKWLILVALAKQLAQSKKHYSCYRLYEKYKNTIIDE